MINKRFVFILLAILLLVSIIGTFYITRNQDNALPANLREKFGCDRTTKELRNTDKYCNDYDLYKQDHAAGVI